MYLFGWGLPALMTSVWLLVTMVYYKKSSSVCWWGYSLLPFFWILEGPRMIIIVVSLGLTSHSLININYLLNEFIIYLMKIYFILYFITLGKFHNINHCIERAVEEN